MYAEWSFTDIVYVAIHDLKLESKPLLQGRLGRVYIGLRMVFRHPSNDSIRSN
jgi:hypothetical protein